MKMWRVDGIFLRKKGNVKMKDKSQNRCDEMLWKDIYSGMPSTSLILSLSLSLSPLSLPSLSLTHSSSLPLSPSL